MANATNAAGSKRRFVPKDLLVVVPLAIALGAVALVATPSSHGTRGETVTPVAAIVGEHSAGGERAVDALNASIASMQGLRGEHAGLSRQDYAAAATLDH